MGTRLALLGAFPFPYPQGSQIFVAEQARALMNAGHRPVLFSYGRGMGEPPRDLELAATARWTAPRAMRSGPQWGKPLADAALLARYRREAARARFDVALAHNAEAALIALAARGQTRVPVVYVAHTLLRHELSAYGPERAGPLLDRVGRAVDRSIARRADGIIALCEEARRELAPMTQAPIAVIPPGLDPAPAPGREAQRELCQRLGLRLGDFVLYSGNLDRYQDLDLLARAAERLPSSAPPVVLASHDPRSGRRLGGVALGRLRRVTVSHFEQMRLLCHAARVLVLTRRRPGGFPVKLLNYMEAARPIVAFENVAGGLEHERSAWLLERGAHSGELVSAIERLTNDTELSERLGRNARRRLEQHHAWSSIARRTGVFLAELRSP